MDIEVEAVFRNFCVGVPHGGPLEVAESGVGRRLARVGWLSGL